MNIIGLHSLVFGVDDMAACRQYLLDYGLVQADEDHFEALDGSCVVIRPASDASLPVANAPAPNLRETIYAVADADTLEAIAAELDRDRAVRRDDQGVLHCVDDGGFAIGFRVTQRRTIIAPPVQINVPGQTMQRAPNVLGAAPDAKPQPRSLSHVVYFVPDAVKAEKFYAERLGFRTTDRFIGLGPFMRPQGTLEHHCLFMIQSFNPHMIGMNHFTFHFGALHEVLQAGWEFQRKGYKSFWGPGRHIMGSNHFWYFNSPFGGTMEFDADMDQHDDSWTPRAMPPGADNSQIFLFDWRNKWAPAMPNEQALCRLDDIADGGSRGLLREGADDRVFVVRRGGQVFVYLNSCPHNRRPLEYMQDRFLSADHQRIVCYAHGAHFSIESGFCLHGPCAGQYLSPVPARIVDGLVMIPETLPALPQPSDR